MLQDIINFITVPSGNEKHCCLLSNNNFKSKRLQRGQCTITVSVGQQEDQAVEAGVGHLRDVSGAPADGLDGGRRKRLILTLHIRLEHTNICLNCYSSAVLKPSELASHIFRHHKCIQSSAFSLKLPLRIQLKVFSSQLLPHPTEKTAIMSLNW